MTADRRPRNQPKAQRLPDGRYLRYSYRFNCYQVQGGPLKEWRNLRPQLFDCYVAAGFPVEVQGPAPLRVQMDMWD